MGPNDIIIIWACVVCTFAALAGVGVGVVVAGVDRDGWGVREHGRRSSIDGGENLSAGSHDGTYCCIAVYLHNICANTSIYKTL